MPRKRRVDARFHSRNNIGTSTVSSNDSARHEFYRCNDEDIGQARLAGGSGVLVRERGGDGKAAGAPALNFSGALYDVSAASRDPLSQRICAGNHRKNHCSGSQMPAIPTRPTLCPAAAIL